MVVIATVFCHVLLGLLATESQGSGTALRYGLLPVFVYPPLEEQNWA